MNLYDKMDAAVDAGNSREEVLKMFEDEINAYARAEYIRQCYLSSLSDEELRKLEYGAGVALTSWLETR